MDITKLTSRAIQNKPASRRPSQAAKFDPSRLIRMGFNENPYGMSPKAVEAIRNTASEANNYPDFGAGPLKKAIADFYHLTPDCVLTGSGSSAMIDMLGMTFLNEGDEVLLCMPTFAAFIDMAYVNGAVPVIVPVTEDQRYDLDALRKAVTDKTKLVIICNPNNPTGTYRTADEIFSFIESLPETVVTAVDEAYIEFAEAPDCESMVSYLNRFTRPVVILKTFSKYYAMAGVRVGYALSTPELIAEMNKCPAAWNLNKMGQAAAVAALADQAFSTESKGKIVESRHWLTEQMQKLGCTVYPSQTNFIYFSSPVDPVVLKQKMQDSYGIMIGAFEMSRVSIGLPEWNQAFIDALTEILNNCTK